ncbi:uncharacterized protein A1O9_05873 [Exophiala aquamarina CBS 119918]|uniref:Uncharacterized protein n=1 Tax=Exophiala aquamarina CBS 119918 TaxID=1182545 RepID=A0A072PDL2_9EURO|nr:uncharacterized protein A1O9_05873 [Exophiala aquamarina CBS 119918]KEF57951.1 hypothetical protein A1O9_05873 [Exophiala aquamarina CBS 119918]
MAGLLAVSGGYIAALEKRLLETELALFDALQLLSLQPSSLDGRVADAETAKERQYNVDTNKVITKQNINQTKAEKVAEWERLPIRTSSQQTEWLNDRLSLVGLLAEKSAQQQPSSKKRPQVQRSASSSDLQQQPFLPTGFTHNQDTGSYASPGGTSDGSATRDSNTMMPPPARPVNIGKSFTSSPESVSSTSFVAYRAPTQPPETWRNLPPVNATTTQPSWLPLQDPDQSHRRSTSAEGNNANSPAGGQTLGGSSRAQQLSSSQWRRFF